MKRFDSIRVIQKCKSPTKNIVKNNEAHFQFALPNGLQMSLNFSLCPLVATLAVRATNPVHFHSNFLRKNTTAVKIFSEYYLSLKWRPDMKRNVP